MHAISETRLYKIPVDVLDDVVPPVVLQPQVLVGLDEGLDVAALELRGRDARLGGVGLGPNSILTILACVFHLNL